MESDETGTPPTIQQRMNEELTGEEINNSEVPVTDLNERAFSNDSYQSSVNILAGSSPLIISNTRDYVPLVSLNYENRITNSDSNESVLSTLPNYLLEYNKSGIIDFDQNEVEFFEIIRRVSAPFVPPSRSFYGQYTDPDDGTIRYVSLPIKDYTGIESENDEEQNEEEVIDADPDRTINGPSIDTSVLQPSPMEQTSSAPAPIITTFDNRTPSNSGRKRSICSPPNGKDLMHYRKRSRNISQFSPGNSIDACKEAEIIFAQRVSALTESAKRHTSFPDQEFLFTSLGRLSDCSRLDDNHLKAFEVDFDNFYKLVSKCPQKYFLPSLALALQYDEDFPKFLKLFFGSYTKNYDLFIGLTFYAEGIGEDYQMFFIDLILRMTIVSKAATDFFSSNRNAPFFFSDSSTFPCYYGKFSPHKITKMLSKYRYYNFDFSTIDSSKNLLKKFILDFDYVKVIDLFQDYQSFAKIHMHFIFEPFYTYIVPRNLFKSEEDINSSTYKLFKTAHDDQPHFTNHLLTSGKIIIVLKEALKREDFRTVGILFKKFHIEEKSRLTYRYEKDSENVTVPLSVEVEKINSRFCLVKVTYENTSSTPFVSMILPFNHQ